MEEMDWMNKAEGWDWIGLEEKDRRKKMEESGRKNKAEAWDWKRNDRKNKAEAWDWNGFSDIRTWGMILCR
jgi:hypothetical protein